MKNVTYDDKPSLNGLHREQLLASLKMACDWLTDIAQVKTEQLTIEENTKQFAYRSWKGAIRGEYTAAQGIWGFFCPVWHTGQAVKALVKAYRLLGDEKYLQAAKEGAAFIYDKQIWEPGHPDHGLILAFEDRKEQAETSAILEALDGLMHLAELEQSEESWQRIEQAAQFLVDKCFYPEQGVFRDFYNPAEHKVVLPNPLRSKEGIEGRPLLDDGIYLRLYHKTGRADFLQVHLQICDRLIEDQNPRGNWIDYGPCRRSEGTFHPRHTYWWGMPFVDTYLETNNSIYLETAIASGEFNLRAMRRDGGWIRVTDVTFNTDSFGHATSGSACAAIFYMKLYEVTKEERWLQAAEKAVGFCRNMQIINPQDPNLKGVILEKVLPPDGTDKSPYHVRDLGTIFYIQAAVDYLNLAAD